MKRLLVMLVALCGMLLAAPRSRAGAFVLPSLSLTTSSNLSNLTVGDTVTFNVNLLGLPAGSALDLLDATVQFNPAIFGTPFNIQGGAILPNPLADPSDFGFTTIPGLVDAAFFTGGTFSQMIGTNGVFYSFNLTALAPGSGAIGFTGESGDILLSKFSEAGVQFTPATTPDLSYTVKAASIGGSGATVPLPASLWGALILLAALSLPKALRHPVKIAA